MHARVDNLLETGAATKVAVEGFDKIFTTWLFWFFNKRPDLHQNTWGAESALQSSFFHEGIDHRFPFFWRKPLRGQDLLAFNTFHRRNAGFDRFVVQQYRTATADPFRRASVLGRDDFLRVPQVLHQVEVWIPIVISFFSVQIKFHLGL